MSRVNPPIFLHVERLVLNGMRLTEGQCTRMQAAMKGELRRLITERGDLGWHGPSAITRAATAPSVSCDAKNPQQLGRALAQGVFACLSHSSLEVGQGGKR
jgi:hypothetical protein